MRMCCTRVHALPSAMATLSAFVSESHCQEARQNAAAAAGDDDYCYPIYQPRVQKVPLEAQLVQLCRDASRLRCQLAAVDAQICQLAAVVPSPWLSHSTPLSVAPLGLESGSNVGEISQVAITRRKVSNKTIARTTVTATPPHKVEFAMMDDVFGFKSAGSSLVKALSLEPASTVSMEKCRLRTVLRPIARGSGVAASDRDLARRLLDERAEAYEKGAGPDDSGSTISKSSEGENCILCEEPACYTCWSGCRLFCQMCHVAHTDDGCHWAP